MKIRYVLGLSLGIICAAMLNISYACADEGEVRIELYWSANSDVNVTAEVMYLMNPDENVEYNPYDFIETEKEENRSIITIKNLDGIYDFDVCAFDPCFNNALSSVEMEAYVYLPGETEPLVYEYLGEDTFRSYTGIWLWGPFSICEGEIGEYDRSWLNQNYGEGNISDALADDISKGYISVEQEIIDSMKSGNVEEIGEFSTYGDGEVCSLSLDLNADGIAESIDYYINEIEGTYYDGRCSAHKNELLVNQKDSINNSGYAIWNVLYGVSIDGENINLITYDNGPSNDPDSRLYQYNGESLIEIGELLSSPDDMYVKDGYLHGFIRTDCIQTEQMRVKWKINEFGQMEQVEEDYYELVPYFDREDVYDLLKEIEVYKTPDSEEFFIMEPGKVSIPYTDNHGWIYVENMDKEGGWLYADGLSSNEKFEIFDGLTYFD